MVLGVNLVPFQRSSGVTSSSHGQLKAEQEMRCKKQEVNVHMLPSTMTVIALPSQKSTLLTILLCLSGWTGNGLPCSVPGKALRPMSKAATTSQTWRLNEKETSSFDETDKASQGLVSTLTGLVNSFSPRQDQSDPSATVPSERRPPASVQELEDRLRDDYIVNNYLWTGDLDLECFDPSCTFQDPTLSFEGTDTFQTNTQNLVPLVERFVENYESVLLDIQSTPEYVETRWNMIGELNGLFWKPKIDVIGRTKFWFRSDEPSPTTTDSTATVSSSIQVYKYDEEWEIPAYQALLQLLTPAGTFPNSSAAGSSDQ